MLAGTATVAALFVLFPFVLVAAATPIHMDKLSGLELNATLVPVSSSLATSATAEPNGVLLQWRATKPRPGRIFYRVYRTPPSAGLTCDPAGACAPAPTDVWCRQLTSAPDKCTYSPGAQQLGTTRQGAWLDRPPPGTWIYRIGLAANWVNDPTQGDVYVLGPPAQITVPNP